jgi:hypothetical protein
VESRCVTIAAGVDCVMSLNWFLAEDADACVRVPRFIDCPVTDLIWLPSVPSGYHVCISMLRTLGILIPFVQTDFSLFSFVIIARTFKG